MTDLIFCDFEYSENPDKHPRAPRIDLLLGCFQHGTERTAIDFRQPGATALLAQYVAQHPDATWLSYAAHAEVTAMLTAGIDVAQMRWVDLMAEARQITSSHPNFYLSPRRTNLLTTLGVMGIPTEGEAARKDAMRDLILSRVPFTEAQFDDIVRYCWSDITPLPALWDAIQAIHATAGCSYELAHAQHRGEAVRAHAMLDFNSRGFPINVPLLERVYANRKLVMRAIAEQANATYGRVYRHNKLHNTYHFFYEGLTENILAQAKPVDWTRTVSGRLMTREDYLIDVAARYPYYKPLVSAMLILRHFASTDLRKQLRGTYIHGVSLDYHTTTGRSQPLVSRGFVLNMQPWLRTLVRPEPDHVLISADWSQQEIVVAAALSGDQNMASALATGDFYTALGHRSGTMPPGSTKQTHPVQRQVMKSCSLGLGYGMQVKSLGNHIYADLKAQATDLNLPLPHMIDCLAQADTVLRWHRTEFETFWKWSERVVWNAQHDGYCRTLDGWTTFCNLNSSGTRLGNFPVQGNSATILRQALKGLAKRPEVEFCCSLHDAIYITAHKDNAAEHTAILVDVMNRAAKSVLQHTPMPLPINIDVHQYDHATGYQDGRDTTTLPTILAMLDAAGV